MGRDYVAFTTAMFRSDQPDEEIDRRFLGEDCAHWLQSRLAAVDDIIPVSPPIEEDWHGWDFKICVQGIAFWILVWGIAAPGWIVGIEPPPLSRVFRRKRTGSAQSRLCEAIDAILAAAPEIARRRWTETFEEATAFLAPDARG